MLTKPKRDYLMFKIRGKLVKVDPDIFYKIINPRHEIPDGKYIGGIAEMRLSDGYPILVFRTANPKKFKYIALSRFVMNAGPGQIVDHINGDPLDNRRSRLRIVTPRQNGLNKKLKCTAGFIGVNIYRKINKRYCVARFQTSDGKAPSFSLVDTPENRVIAAFARDRLVLQAGDEDYARLNFPCFKFEPFRSYLLSEDFNKYRKNKRKTRKNI